MLPVPGKLFCERGSAASYGDTNKIPASPEVRPDRTVTLRLFAPKASEVHELLTKKDVEHVWNECDGGLARPICQVYLSKYAPLVFRE